MISWCSVFKRERCKLMQDHARKSKILYYIYIYLWWAVWGRVFEIVVGCMDCAPPLLSAYICQVWMVVVFETCKLDYFRCWTWWCFAEDANVHTVKLTFSFYFLFNLILTLCHKVTYCLLLYHNVAYLAKHFSGCVGWKCTRGRICWKRRGTPDQCR